MNQHYDPSNPTDSLLLPEQIQLLIQSENGALPSSNYIDGSKAIAAGMVWELQQAGALAFEDHKAVARRATSDLGPEFDKVLAALQEKQQQGKRPTSQVLIDQIRGDILPPITDKFRDRLLAKGLMDHKTEQVLIFQNRTHQTTDAGRAAATRIRDHTQVALSLLRSRPNVEAVRSLSPRSLMAATLLDSYNLLSRAFPSEQSAGRTLNAAAIAALAGLTALVGAGGAGLSAQQQLEAQRRAAAQQGAAQPGEGLDLSDAGDLALEVAEDAFDVGAAIGFVPDLLSGIGGAAGAAAEMLGGVGEVAGGILGGAAEVAGDLLGGIFDIFN